MAIGCGGGSDGSHAKAAVAAAETKVAALNRTAGAVSGLDCTNETDPPNQLGCTLLYQDWATKTLATDVVFYEPGFQLWSDGAEKSRYIALPPGTQIDTRDMDEWIFPEGTRVWKEFRLNGRRVETRFMKKNPDGSWIRTTYRWSNNDTVADQLTTGERNVDGTAYEIPTQAQCVRCHGGRVDNILGFEAIALSSPQAQGATMEALVRDNLITQPPAQPIVVPGNNVEVLALGSMHMNCGTGCHNSGAGWYSGGSTGLWLKLQIAQLASVDATDTWTTSVGVASRYQPPGGGHLRITPGDPSTSTVLYRAATRDAPPLVQMPPLGTHTVDQIAVDALTAWIESIPAG